MKSSLKIILSIVIVLLFLVLGITWITGNVTNEVFTHTTTGSTSIMQHVSLDEGEYYQFRITAKDPISGTYHYDISWSLTLQKDGKDLLKFEDTYTGRLDSDSDDRRFNSDIFSPSSSGNFTIVMTVTFNDLEGQVIMELNQDFIYGVVIGIPLTNSLVRIIAIILLVIATLTYQILNRRETD